MDGKGKLQEMEEDGVGIMSLIRTLASQGNQAKDAGNNNDKNNSRGGGVVECGGVGVRESKYSTRNIKNPP